MKRKHVWLILITLTLSYGIYSISFAGETEDYTFAYKLYEEGVYAVAKSEFQKFLVNYPNSDRADDAKYLMGVCAFGEGKYNEAIQYYQQLINDYPASPLRLDAVHDRGEDIPDRWAKQSQNDDYHNRYQNED